MGEQLGREFVNAYLASLRARADVTINQSLLEGTGGRQGEGTAPGPARPAPQGRGAPR